MGRQAGRADAHPSVLVPPLRAHPTSPSTLSAARPPHTLPAACMQYLELDPLHSEVVRAAHWWHRQALEIMSPVSITALDASAGADDLAQCQAVVWSVQVGGTGGSMLPCAAQTEPRRPGAASHCKPRRPESRN